MVKLMSILC